MLMFNSPALITNVSSKHPKINRLLPGALCLFITHSSYLNAQLSACQLIACGHLESLNPWVFLKSPDRNIADSSVKLENMVSSHLPNRFRGHREFRPWAKAGSTPGWVASPSQYYYMSIYMSICGFGNLLMGTSAVVQRCWHLPLLSEHKWSWLLNDDYAII